MESRMYGPIPSTWAGGTMSLLRIVSGLAFMLHGTQKIFGFPGDGSGVELMSIFGLAGVLELVGGPLIALGLFTRPTAFILAGEMAIAYLWRHLPNSIWPSENGGELALLFCFIFLFFAAAGPGTWAIDKPHALPPRSH